MSIFSSLSSQQKEAVGLLQIGTFLEYFDLMLYVHMAVLLNELFFPKTDPHTASLIAALAFCSTYVLRPFGALLFGWIGDNIGRKPTVVITTIMMAVSCIIMANLPTYAQIGISAAWIVTFCRITQGLSAMGEVIGAEIYLTEVIPLPQRYPVVSCIRIVDDLGSVLAIAVASLVTIAGMNWRVAFWIGACIAVVGSLARTRLRETAEFVNAKILRKNATKKAGLDEQDKVNPKTAMAYFLMHCGYPIFFFFSFVFCSSVLKNKFGYTADQIIHQNLIVAVVGLVSDVVYTMLSKFIFPLKILTFKLFGASVLSLLLPFFLNTVDNPIHLLIMQSFIIFFALGGMPASAVFLVNFPILKRFKSATLLYAVAYACMSIINSFGLIYLVEFFGNYGFYVITIPTCIGFYWAIKHFEKLEKAKASNMTASTLAA
jgi:MHS family proline/betaine transporter-like MFS transporter